jgi:phosphoserine phosphatase
MTHRPFAAFDIDGTIIRWQLYHAIGDALAKEGHIDPELFAEVKAARMNWKRRNGTDGFSTYEHHLVNVFDATMNGLPIEVFQAATDKVFDEYKDQVYTYTRDLIRHLRHQKNLQPIMGLTILPPPPTKRMTTSSPAPKTCRLVKKRSYSPP